MIVTEPKSNQYKDKESGQMKTLPPVYSIKLLLTGHTLAQILEGGLGRWLPDPANPDAVYIVPFFGATEAEKPADLGYDVYRDLVTPRYSRTSSLPFPWLFTSPSPAASPTPSWST